MTLTHRLFLLVAISLLPAVAIQGYNEFDLRRSRAAEVRGLALQRAQLAASEVDQIIAGIGSMLVAVTEAPSVQSLDSGECGALLYELHHKVASVWTISVVDPGGRVACRPVAGSPEVDLAVGGHVREAIATGELVIGDLVEVSAGQPAILPVARPVRDKSGGIVGVAVAALDLNWLSGQLAERGLAEGDSVTIADRNGMIVARAPAPERFVGTTIPEAFRHLLTEPGPGAMEVMSQDGTRRVLGYIPVANRPVPGLYISAGLAADQAFSTIDRATQRGVALIALGLAGALLTAWIVGRRFILQPMAKLITAARRWRSGDFTARAGLGNRPDEFATLGREFDRMAAEIAYREAERNAALAAAHESEARLLAVVESLPFEFWVIDRDGRYVLQNPVSRANWGNRIGKRPDETDTPPALLAAWLANNRRALAGEIVRGEQSWRSGDETRHVEKIIAPIMAGGRVLGAVGLNIDVTQRHEAEQRQRLLTMELNHRVRNMLATIGAIVRLTLTDDRTLEDARDALRDRLESLANTYDLLTAGSWRGAQLRTIAANELRPYGDQARVEGDDALLRPQAAQTIGMILHELATNAAKHGALSNNEGQVKLAIAVVDPGAGARLRLVWAETSGPPVTAPVRRGLGRSMLEHAAVSQLKAEAAIDFRPEGLVYRLEMPLSAVAV